MEPGCGDGSGGDAGTGGGGVGELAGPRKVGWLVGEGATQTAAQSTVFNNVTALQFPWSSQSDCGAIPCSGPGNCGAVHAGSLHDCSAVRMMYAKLDATRALGTSLATTR
jgi:hypothetical protein